MLITLAQAAGERPPQEVLPQLWQRLDALAHPDKLVEVLSQLSMVWAGVFMATGLVCLLKGYRVYKGAVILLALGLGAGVGYQLGQSIPDAKVIVAGCLAVLLAVVAWPMMKYAVAVAAGLAGATIGANAWASLAGKISALTEANISADSYWIGALMGLLLFGLSAFILFELAVVMFTSFGGSTLLVFGMIALLLNVPQVKETVSNSLQADPLVVPLLVIVPAIIGLIFQQQAGGLKKTPAKSG